MAIDFKKFQQNFPADAVKKATEEAANNAPSRTPAGEYRCKVERMEMKESSKGAPMCSIMFRIVAGNRAKCCIFYNSVLAGTKNDGYMIHRNNEFLNSLDSGLDVAFESWEQYNDLIETIFAAITEDNLEYMVKVEQDGDFDRLSIVDIFE